MKMIEIKIPKDEYKIVHKINREEFAPGIWAGCEGLKFMITNIDLINGIVTLEVLPEKAD